MLRLLHLNFRLFLCLLAPKIILTQNTIAIHFYEDEGDNLVWKGIDSCIYTEKFRNFSLEKCNSTNISSNIKILRTFIIDLDCFILKFLNDEEIRQGRQNNIFVDNRLIDSEDFAYFNKTVNSIPFFSDNIDESKYYMMFKIMNVFRFIYNKHLVDFIRNILVSMILNTNAIRKNKHLFKKTVAISCPDYFPKIVIVELFKLYKIGVKTLEKIKDISCAVKITKEFTYDFLNLNEEYLFLDADVIQEVIKTNIKANCFFQMLDIMFNIQIFKRLFMYNISYTEKFKYFFNLSLFQNLDEIFLLECTNTDSLIRTLCKTCDSISVKTLSIVYCKFTVNDEISWLKKFNFQNINFVFEIDLSDSYFSISKLEASISDVFLELIDEVYNKENKLNFFVHNSKISCFDQENSYILHFYQPKSKLKYFKIPEATFKIFLYMELLNSFITFTFNMMNFDKLKNIMIEFKNTDLEDFNLRETEIYNNIVRMHIVESTINNVFLSKILLLKSLSNILFYACKIVFTNEKVAFKENTNIVNVHFACSFFEDHNSGIEFLNKMSAMKILKVVSYNGHTNPFAIEPSNEILRLDNLASLDYSVSYVLNEQLPSFSFIPRLSYLNFGFDYPENSLYKIFGNKNLNFLKTLRFDTVIIGKKDKQMLVEYTNLLHLRFSEGSKISGILFSELFDLTRTYLFTELILPKIEITYCELQFFSSLKSLMKLYIHEFTLEKDILYFFKTFNLVKKIEIGNTKIFKNETREEIGGRLKNRADIIQ
ncbi:hypothetical protein CWI36_0010p0010 [Hamiltosporidium magnivora]|uniref:Uncharacterized protein n=1 Tax=Hamiltosporidium magnivora TaxID=148818 RepID=A0A4Q9LNF0_9MICR|nr:hypothetical protein CWI36_0010p0010 [Hamiltosporidium magnivora]